MFTASLSIRCRMWQSARRWKLLAQTLTAICSLKVSSLSIFTERSRSVRPNGTTVPQIVIPSDWSSFAICWCAIDDSLCLGRVERKIVFYMPSGDCIDTFGEYRQSDWWCRIHDRVQLRVIGGLVESYSERGDEAADRRISASREPSPAVHRRTTLPSGSGNWRRRQTVHIQQDTTPTIWDTYCWWRRVPSFVPEDGDARGYQTLRYCLVRAERKAICWQSQTANRSQPLPWPSQWNAMSSMLTAVGRGVASCPCGVSSAPWWVFLESCR